MAGARAEHRSANRPCVRRIWRLAGPVVNASRTRRPLNWTLRFSAILKDMSTGERHLYGRNREAEQLALQREWRRLTRAATFVAVLTSPVDLRVLLRAARLAALWALVGTFVFIIAFRGFVDVLAHQLIPRASLYGAGRELVEDDIVAAAARLVLAHEVPPCCSGSCSSSALALGLLMAIFGMSIHDISSCIVAAAADLLPHLRPPAAAVLLRATSLILFGPLLFFGLKQMKGYEPGDADWGVKLADVRGQTEPQGGGRRRSSSCGRRATSSARRAASPSAACCSSARRAPARRCSPRASRRRSTRRS